MFNKLLGKKPETDNESTEASDVEVQKTFVPFATASESTNAPEQASLSEDQVEKLKQVYRHFNEKSLKVPCTEDDCKKESPLNTKALDENEKAWLSRENFLRYLRATKWVTNQAINRITLTLAWRREYGVAGTEETNTLNSALASPENETGKEVILGFDNDKRPCLYLKPGRQNTKPSDRQVQHMVYMLERTIDFMPSGQDALSLLIDLKQYDVGTENSKLPSVSTGRKVLHILQTHYPERLGKALLVNISWVAWTFLKLIHPFIDPMTREKLVYDKPFTEFVPAEQLDRDFGGEVYFEYDHQKYWGEMVKMAAAKREKYMARFRKFGGVVGLSETDLNADSDFLLYPVSLLEDLAKEEEKKENKKDNEKKEENDKKEANDLKETNTKGGVVKRDLEEDTKKDAIPEISKKELLTQRSPLDVEAQIPRDLEKKL